MTPARIRRRPTCSWPIVRSALVFVALLAMVLTSWLPSAAGRSLVFGLDVLLLLVFLGIVVAFTVERNPGR